MKRRNPVLSALLATFAIAASVEPGSGQTYDYHQGGGVTVRQLQRLNYYSRHGQSHRDMRRLLGSPNRIEPNTEIYTIRESVTYHQGIPLNAGKQLVIRYDRQGRTSHWYTFP